MADTGNTNIFVENLKVLSNPENFQKYVLGYKKNGRPRAAYDVVRDCTGLGKKKKKKKKKKEVPVTAIGFYTSVKKGKKKKKKKKNRKHWNING